MSAKEKYRQKIESQIKEPLSATSGKGHRDAVSWALVAMALSDPGVGDEVTMLNIIPVRL